MGDAHKRYHPFNFWKKDFPIFYHFYQGFVLDKFFLVHGAARKSEHFKRATVTLKTTIS